MGLGPDCPVGLCSFLCDKFSVVGQKAWCWALLDHSSIGGALALPLVEEEERTEGECGFGESVISGYGCGPMVHGKLP